jgi:streptogramin lyase
MTTTRRASWILPLLLLAACDGWEPRHLQPYPNPFGPGDEGWAEQPHRDNPLEVLTTPDGRVWVTLQGSPDEPGRHVAVVDGGDVRRIAVGSGPTGLALHPSGRWIVVANRFSNYLSVIDVAKEAEVRRLPTDFYGIAPAFTPDGEELWLTNRWRDAVLVFGVRSTPDALVVDWEAAPVPVDTNPRDLAISPDGATVAVAALTGTTVSLIDRRLRAEMHRIELGAPANDVAFVDGFLVVATLSASTHHLPLAGPDTDHDGRPGDSTPNMNFSDLQNELAVFDATGAPLHRYTSDTICCRDYRDVRPEHTERHGELLPPRDTWIVGGALPEQLAVDGDAVWVTYSASNEVQRFELDPATGALSPGPVLPAGGHEPHGIAVGEAGIFVAHRLGETLGRLDRDGALRDAVVVGDVDGGPFPATDAEIGELFNFVTAPFSIDGDLSCQHCHREGGNIDKAFSMPLTRRPGVGLRQTMAYRGAADSRPWFFEAAMDQTNFVPVMNELARIENFCCSDYTLWTDGPPAGCAEDPPPACRLQPAPDSPDGVVARRPAADSPLARPRAAQEATRDAFYEDRMAGLIGRTESFGDGLYFEDVLTGEREPLPLDFDGITQALGLFLLQEPALLPNPNDPDRGAVQRGKALFESPATGCSGCHVPPSFSLSIESGGPTSMGPVVTPLRDADGTNLDLFAQGFIDLFPDSRQDSCEDACGPAICLQDPSACDDLRDVAFGVTSLRGIWDRAPGMLHHGRARGLIEVLATPGHEALAPHQRGFNELDGMPDSHGGTSHLDASELDDLVQYLRTL